MAILCALLAQAPAAHALQCTRRAVVQSAADVYQAPPRYVTGVGWQGERIDVLSAGTQILQCAQRDVSFGFSSKTWSQVAYRGGKGWRYGWILQETLRYVSAGRRVLGSGGTLIPAAYQLAADSGESAKWTIGDEAPSPPPAPTESISTSMAAPVNTPTLGEQLALYWPLFAAMLLGMVAKAGVDLLEQWDKALVARHVRNGLVAILVSPIVFLGFLNAGQFGSSQQTFLVLLMLSFQNGFFWQTILKGEFRSAQKKDRSRRADAAGEGADEAATTSRR